MAVAVTTGVAVGLPLPLPFRARQQEPWQAKGLRPIPRVAAGASESSRTGIAAAAIPQEGTRPTSAVGIRRR